MSNNNDAFAIVIHGGAGPDSDFIHKNKTAYEQGLLMALNAGYRILEMGGSAVDGVEVAVKSLEDNPLFNAGRGSSLNEKGEAEMCASVMQGSDKKFGAAAIVKGVKNPVCLVREIMEGSEHLYVGGEAATEVAVGVQLPVEPPAYFVTDHAWEEFSEAQKAKPDSKPVAMHGTVGAVALDRYGNVAAATSTGGAAGSKPGRIGDSSMIGVGTYAGPLGAISSTGDGENIIQEVLAFHAYALAEYKKMEIRLACKFLLHEKLKDSDADMGLIAIDAQGNIAMEFNSDRMHRAWKSANGEAGVAIYKMTSDETNLHN